MPRPLDVTSLQRDEEIGRWDEAVTALTISNFPLSIVVTFHQVSAWASHSSYLIKGSIHQD